MNWNFNILSCVSDFYLNLMSFILFFNFNWSIIISLIIYSIDWRSYDIENF
jgi:hypothetical protein